MEKNNTRDAIAPMIRKISGYFEQVYGLKSPYYKLLGIKGFIDAKDDIFLVTARRVVQTAQAKLAELSGAGLTQAQIDDLEAMAETFELKLNDVGTKSADRDVQTEERNKLGNALYAQLVKYCAVGKNIWEDVSEAKYNDYVIRKTVHSGLSKVQGFAAVGGGANVFDLVWQPVVGADNYEVEFAQATTGQPQGPWQPYSSPETNSDTFPVNPGFSYWLRVRARNNEGLTGGWSDTVIVEGT